MRRTLGALVLLCLAPAAAGQAPARPGSPDLPDLTAAQGRALVDLAREAMRRYLVNRVLPEAVPVPDAIRVLKGRRNAAAVTLRDAGSVAAVQVRTESDLCTNVAAAALLAMRSPKLPDRVDQKVLDGLAVEVEVLSELRPVDRAQLQQAVAPGLTGLAYTRGEAPASAPGAGLPRAMSWVLPSAGYVLGLDAEEMRRAAMGRFQLTPANAALPSQLATFTARHYVSLPDGRFFELFRGKDLSLPPSSDGQSLAAAAAQIGRFLVARQSQTGKYEPPEGSASVREHLYAAWAVAKLARRTGEAQFARSVAAATAHVAGSLQRTGGKAVVNAGTHADTLAATALLALVLGEAQPDAAGRRLREELSRGLVEQLGSAAPATAASRPAGASEETCIALLALGEAAGTAELRAKAAAAGFADPNAALWACRAGLEGASPWPGNLAISQLGGTALPDERGGFILAGGGPTTLHTALASLCLAKELARLGGASPEAVKLRAQLVEARCFCCRMMYRPGEAYFSDKPDAWLGAVRASPGAAAATLSACAAALDALLSE